MPLCTLGYETLEIPRVWGNTLGIPLLPAGKPPPSDPYGGGEEPFRILLGDETMIKLQGVLMIFDRFFRFFFLKKQTKVENRL